MPHPHSSPGIPLPIQTWHNYKLYSPTIQTLCNGKLLSATHCKHMVCSNILYLAVSKRLPVLLRELHPVIELLLCRCLLVLLKWEPIKLLKSCDINTYIYTVKQWCVQILRSWKWKLDWTSSSLYMYMYTHVIDLVLHIIINSMGHDTNIHKVERYPLKW